MTITAYAQRRGIARNNVYAALNDGRLPPSVRHGKKIDADAADAAWAANTDTSKPRNSVTGNPKMCRRRQPKPDLPATTDDTASENGDSESAPGVGQTLNAARIRTELAKAARSELELRRLQGEVVDAETVRKSAFHTHRVIRDLLMALPARVSAELAGLTDDAECYAVLEREIRKVCEQIAEAVEKPVPGMRGRG